MGNNRHDKTPDEKPGVSNKTLFFYLLGLVGLVFVIVIGGRLFVHAMSTSVGMNESVALLLFGALLYGVLVWIRKMRA